MQHNRQTPWLELLKRGGALRMQGENFLVFHPFAKDPIEVKKADIRPLMNSGQLVCINCGCTGFWWTFVEAKREAQS